MDWSRAEKYFQKYYDKLIGQTINARAHLKIWECLENYKSSYLHELNQAPHFFTFTIRAHLDDALMTLSRILDRHADSLSIWKFLNYVERNRKIFSKDVFSQRMKGNTYYDSLMESHTPITRKEIEEDRQELGNLEHIIDNLNTWRDKVIAHTDRKFLLTGRIVYEEYPLQRQQLQEVIDTLLKIINRYSRAYNSSTYLERIPGEDDVKHIMNFIRSHIQERKKQFEAFKE